ncbi:MAG: sulfatase [Planctomycetaceae bacterium]
MKWRSMVFALMLLACQIVQGAERPNFVIFVADDMAWEDCGAYGHPHIRTPNIDRLAREGLRFDAAFLTCSSCSPSRCSMLTGRYPHSTGAGELHLPLPKTQQLFSTPLREGGYYTAAVGKWHLGSAAESQMDLVKTGGGPGGEEDWVSVLKNRPQDKPFFLWLAATDPHRDYRPGAIDPPHQRSDVVVPPIFPDTPAVRDDLALYYDEIGRFDHFIGLVRDELASQGVLDNTMILVISDNGRPFPRCKNTVNEDGVRTPFIVRFPKLVMAQGSTSSLVSSVDIAATVLELAGVSNDFPTQGRSFVPILKDPQASIRSFAFSEHNWHDYRAFERSVRSTKYRYILNELPNLPGTPPADAVRSPTYREMQRQRDTGTLPLSAGNVFIVPSPREGLYDIAADPHCLNNLVDRLEYHKVLYQHQQELANWQKDTNDTFPGEDHLTPDGFHRETGNKLPGIKGAHPSLGK